MTGRKLRPDELALWREVNTKTQAYGRPAGLPDRPTPKLPEPKAKPVFSASLKPTGADRPSTSVDRAPTLTDQFSGQSPAMDRKTFTHLKRGKLTPEGKLDLHGMTVDRAHAALSRFIMSGHSAGKRLLLVVTGKGKYRDDIGPIPVRFGVLRHQVPQWLSLPPLKSAVLQVTPAHQRHGGTGAYYVYLRRSR